jgi:hypothetical protein
MEIFEVQERLRLKREMRKSAWNIPRGTSLKRESRIFVEAAGADDQERRRALHRIFSPRV